MEHRFSRRNFIRALGAGGAATALAACGTLPGRRPRGPNVVVVGGGPGGATTAKYLKRFDPNMQVTLVEPKATYHTCFGSNWVLGGLAGMDSIEQTYGALKDQHDVNVVKDTVATIDPDARQVRLAGGDTLSYDKLVLSPGIDFRFNAVEGYSEAVSRDIPHAWKAGEQTRILRDQLRAMDDGGVFVLVAPGNPFRCPPGPYERASMVAHYFKQHKPRSKVIILDNKESFSKQGLFMAGWEQLYGDMIEWVPSSQGGQVEQVDPATRTVYSDGGLTRFRADVLNVVPPQQAGAIAQETGLANDTGWCPVDQLSFQSEKNKDIFVIGDACIAGAMPKSGHSANTQGKAVAAAIVRSMNDQEMLPLSTVNTCYSLVGPDYGITVAAVYRFQDGGIAGVPGSGGVSPSEASHAFRRQEARYAQGWYDSITADTWG
ncbi:MULTISPECIES: NAD(P)/FAD-dependent oxidoreductase [unclassified Ectothiorhodospira]|uniref:NAD(P)/FAD-dependent oxidoreductase n=1 Tax=unclassified Ectothiorhodospira TaxID=2684909 RepID=UPI001EE86E52|nr:MULTISPECIES: NAD(P)/FAD-dependent oxidoreductase [unclassified Ectothiorhodospira]MCG5516165.1 NAD(P)/FAD-dependent oxidoreductase [Ectothiorhodospira sp. 9100]MCG5519607.1 NAD(P)/FAD-dependent oxidoreductase [Ectothiorhodospira sp. 9905]